VGEDRIGRVVGRRLQPAADGEGLIKLKVAGRGERSGLAIEGGGRAFGALLPGERGGELDVLLFAGEEGDRLLAFTFTQRQVQQWRVVGQAAVDALEGGVCDP